MKLTIVSSAFGIVQARSQSHKGFSRDCERLPD